MKTRSIFRPSHTSTPTRANQQNKYNKRPLRIINVNFQSVVAKKASIQHLIDSMKPDIIFGTETMLDENILDSEAIPGPYKLYRKDRNRDGGGVLIAIRTDLKSYPVPELQTDCEMIWAAVKITGRKTLYLSTFYRPNVRDKIGIEGFKESLKRFSTISNAHVMIGGDFNLPGWNWQTTTLKPNAPYPETHRDFLETIRDHGLEQLVTFPTRLENTLDLVLTNTPSLVPRIESVMGVSDHEIVYIEYSINVQKTTQKPRKIQLLNKANWEEMRHAFNEFNDTLQRESSNNEQSTEELWCKFKNAYTEIIEKFIPTKQARPKNNKPWVSREIKNLINRRARLYKKMKKSGSEKIRKECLDLRRLIQRKLRQAYWAFITDSLTEEATNNEEQNKTPQKKFWSYIKQQKDTKIGVSPLKVNGRLVAEPTEQANILNQQFQTVFTEGRSYTDEEFRRKCDMKPSTYANIELTNIDITIKGVHKLLQDLNPHKASGPDGISCRVLKTLACEIAPILTCIFKSSISSAEVPEDWRSANVAPVFKKGEHYDPANYRPVSLTSVPCKILEHIVVSQMMNHLETNKILSNRQHGFRKGRSCETQLLELTEELNETMENGGQTDIIVMDFAKAFDKVNHSLLLHKLNHYGVRGNVNRWIESFLRNRIQAVVVDNVKSSPCKVRSGVPQGSVLGPCLFLAYINDLPDNLQSQTRLFADDTVVYRHIKTTEDQTILQKDLVELEKWERDWDMSFHPSKCTTLPIISPKRKNNLKTPHYQLHGQELKNVTSTKYLGVTITQDLRWDHHINNNIKKANKTLGFLKRNLKINSRTIKNTAYKAFVRPLLEYACTIWDPYTEEMVTSIEAIQRRAARFVFSDYHRQTSVTQMIKSLEWEPLEHRRKVARLSMIYKILHKHVQVDFGRTKKDDQQMKFRPATIRNRRRHLYQLNRIQCQRHYRQYSFLPRSIAEWNNLPATAVSVNSPELFKSRASEALLSSLDYHRPGACSLKNQ